MKEFLEIFALQPSTLNHPLFYNSKFMKTMKTIIGLNKPTIAAVLATIMLLTAPLEADWQLITDFSTETEEDFHYNRRYPWGTIYLDNVDLDDPANRGLYIDTGPTDENRGNIYWLALPVPDGGVGPNQQVTLKWDFYAYGPSHHAAIGLAGPEIVLRERDLFGTLEQPSDWGDFESQSRLRGSFDVRDGNRFLISDISVPVGEWMTMYQYIDNATNTFEFWVKRQEDDEPFQIIIEGQSSFLFRNGTTEPLHSVYFGASRATADAYPDAFVFDNIYMDMTGRNPELPEVENTGPMVALGYRLQNGFIDTEEWLGQLYAQLNPFLYHEDLGWIYVLEDSDGFDAKVGSWNYVFFGETRWEDFGEAAGTIVDTDDFMGALYFTDSGYAYSYLLERWIYLVEPSHGSDGAYVFIGPYIRTALTPPPTVDEAHYSIVSLSSAPVINGIIDASEWEGAMHYSLTYEALVANGSGFSVIDRNAESPQPGADRAEAELYVGATARGIYFAFDVTDADLYTTEEFGVAGNGFDGVQIGLNADHDPAFNDRVSTVLLDVNPKSGPGGKTNVFARWAASGYDPAWGVQAASSLHEGGYQIEMFVPWAFLNSFGVDNFFGDGWPFKLTFAVMDFGSDGQQRELLVDSGEGSLTIGNPQTWLNAVIAENLEVVQSIYSIPKVAETPVVDGILEASEWLHALHIDASYQNWLQLAGGTSLIEANQGIFEPNRPRAYGDIFVLATDEAFYMGARIVDPNITITNAFGEASNAMDGVQVAFDLHPDAPDNSTRILFDFTAATMVGDELVGPANIFARWGISGYDPDWGVEAAGSFSEDGYIIEAKIPWDVLRLAGYDNPLGAGDMFKIGFLVVDTDEDGNMNDIITSTGNGVFQLTSNRYNFATLVE